MKNMKFEERFQSMVTRDSTLRDIVGYLKENFSVGDKTPSERDLELNVGYSRQKLERH
tara:strand:+ start:414 stop:587 length:174 start_codon:yes stop_codon:yes gene_type:complete